MVSRMSCVPFRSMIVWMSRIPRLPMIVWMSSIPRWGVVGSHHCNGSSRNRSYSSNGSYSLNRSCSTPSYTHRSCSSLVSRMSCIPCWSVIVRMSRIPRWGVVGRHRNGSSRNRNCSAPYLLNRSSSVLIRNDHSLAIQLSPCRCWDTLIITSSTKHFFLRKKIFFCMW